jgi:hypothetical protein
MNVKQITKEYNMTSLKQTLSNNQELILALAFALSMLALVSYTVIQVSETKALINTILTK